MSISIQGQTGWASIPNSIGRSRLPYPTLALLINLLTHSEGFSASYALIKEQTGMATATISAAIKNLEKLGLLTVKKIPSKGGKYASNHYIFHADNLWKLTPEFVDQCLGSGKTASGNEAGERSTASLNEGGTASGNEVAPLQEMKAKNDHLELPLENDHPPLIPQGGEAETSQQIELAHPRMDTVSKKGTRITPDWMPSQPVIDKMQAQFPDMDFFAIHEEFIDYWLGIPGQRGVKLDWDATWRNWIRRSGSRGDYPRVKGQVSTSRASGGHSKADSKALWYAQRAEELARKYAGGDSGAY